MCWKICFYMDKAWFHFSAYINSQNSRIWHAKSPCELYYNHLDLSKIGVRCTVSRKQIVGPLFFEKSISVKNYPIFWLNSLLYKKRINRTAGFSKVGQIFIPWKQQQLSCRPSSVTALSGVAFGHHDPWTLHHLSSFSGDFLRGESTATIQEAWRISNITWHRNNKLFKSYKKRYERSEWLSSRMWGREGGGHFQHLL